MDFSAMSESLAPNVTEFLAFFWLALANQSFKIQAVKPHPSLRDLLPDDLATLSDRNF